MSWCFCSHVADTSGDDSAYHGILKKRDSVYSDSDLVRDPVSGARDME